MPQDRLRKLTEENKQLANNLKREMEELNPRTAAKSSKSAKKKTAGSDLSSARGSEERQSLPPGRGLKRGRDNEIEKVGSPISSNSSPFHRPIRRTKPSKKALECLEASKSLSPPSRKRIKVAREEPMEPLTTTNKPQQPSEPYSRETPAIPHPAKDDTATLEATFRYALAASLNRGAEDIDVDFWLKEAAVLDAKHPKNPTPRTTTHTEALHTPASPPKINRTPPKRRNHPEKHVPLDQLHDSALANRVSKMLRRKAIVIGKGPDAPWPNGPPSGPQRHPKWLYTLHVDSHNHAKLAFYAELSPTANPVIAGYAPENPPPDIRRRSRPISTTSKKRKTKAAECEDVIPTEGPVCKKIRTRSSSKSDDGALQNLSQEKLWGLDAIAQTPDDSAKASNLRVVSQVFAGATETKEFFHGQRSSNQQLEVHDSEEDTNEELEQEEHFYARPAVRIEIPDHLKAILVDDWENVTKNMSLVPIPANHPVSEILSTYFEEEKGKRRLGSAEADLLEEVVQGTRDYFEQCLGKLLLYRFEREQYLRLHQAMEAGDDEFEGRPLKDKKISEIYGAEHLCRLFGKRPPHARDLRRCGVGMADVGILSVSLPELIAQTNMDAQSVSKLRQEIQALTAWLGKNSTRFFTAEYETAPQEYVDKARGN